MTFEYKPRSRFQWFLRAGQHAHSRLTPAEPERVSAVDAVDAGAVETADEDSGESVRVGGKKVTLSTLCVCGHRHDRHCLRFGVMHWPAEQGSFGFYSCRFEHCESYPRGVPCPCIGFRVTPPQEPAPKKPKVTPWTPCRTCGHWREHHCTPYKRKQPADYMGFTTENGSPFICTHYAPGDYRCDSTHCAMADDTGVFCSCEKYANPFLQKKPRATKKPRAARKPQSKKMKVPDLALDTQIPMELRP